MSRRDDDDLDGIEDLSERQRWAVSRYRARQRRYGSDTTPTNRDRWAQFQAAEEDDERRRFGAH